MPDRRSISTSTRADWTELLHLLGGGDLSGEEVAGAVKTISEAPTDPDYQYLSDIVDDAADTYRVALADSLDALGLLAVSDKIDELHEQLSELFDDPLPPFLAGWEKRRHTTHDYFRWLDAELAGHEVGPGGHELLCIDTRIDDNLRAVVVNRADTGRILTLGQRLGMRINRPPGL